MSGPFARPPTPSVCHSASACTSAKGWCVSASTTFNLKGNDPVLEAVPQAMKPRGRGRRRLDQDHCCGGEPSALPIADGGGGKVQPGLDIGESLAIQAGAGEVGEPITVGV